MKTIKKCLRTSSFLFRGSSFILFLLFNLFLQAQTIRFNKTYIEENPLTLNVVALDTGYVVAGTGNDGRYYILINGTDLQGNLRWVKRYKNSGYHTYSGAQNSLIKTLDGGFALAGSKPGLGFRSGYFMKFDDSFDTLWTKTYLTDTNFIAFYNCTQTNDSCYVLVGEKGVNSNDSKFVLVKINTEGDTLWSKYYGGNSFETGFKVINTKTNDLLAGGKTFSFCSLSTGYCGEWYIIRTDSAGNLNWENHYGNPNYDDGPVHSIINLKDSGFLVSGLKVTGLNGSTSLYKGRIIRFNKNMEIVWDKLYFNQSEMTDIGIIVELQNGDFATVGYESNSYSTHNRPLLFKLNSSGDIIWKREILAPNVDTTFTGGFHTLSTTNDGGYILTGNAYINDPINYNQIWLVKTDNMGCDGVNPCDTTTVSNDLQITPPLADYELIIYPNPAEENILIAAQSTEENFQNAIVTVVDLTGKPVLTEPIEKNTNYHQLNISSIKQGLYFVKIQGKNFVYSGRFMKY